MGLWRFELTELGRQALPALDVADDDIVIGSAAGATIRLPAAVAKDLHVRIQGEAWHAIVDVTIDGAPRTAGDRGTVGDGTTFELGGYRLRVVRAPAGAIAASPQRTESLARELVRGLLGDGAAPTLEVERGPLVGARRLLPPPEATFVIGRGDEATWVLLDEDLSRTHAEVRRGWDGVTVRDLGSKNGTRVDGVRVREPVVLHDGGVIELGNVALRFRDPAERHLRGESTVRAMPPSPGPRGSTSRWPFAIAAAIAVLASAAAIWIMSS
ncbi:MAG: FHA domain-containing protein [Kofleriaceae bacterium]